MTALFKTDIAPASFAAADETCLDAGAGTGLFVSGSAPGRADMMTGGGLDLFVTGVLGAERRAYAGDRTGLFVTGI